MAAIFRELTLVENSPPLDILPVYGSAVLSAALIAKIREITSEDEAQGFFVAIGRRIAARLSMDGAENAQDIAARINGFWDEMGWGEAVLQFDDEGVDILHRNLSQRSGLDDHGSETMGHVLQGAYDSWFRSLGSGPRLRTRVTQLSEGTIELRHGL